MTPGVEHLKGMTKLKALALEDARLSDAGMQYLKDLTQYGRAQPVPHAGLRTRGCNTCPA